MADNQELRELLQAVQRAIDDLERSTDATRLAVAGRLRRALHPFTGGE